MPNSLRARALVLRPSSTANRRELPVFSSLGAAARVERMIRLHPTEYERHRFERQLTTWQVRQGHTHRRIPMSEVEGVARDGQETRGISGYVEAIVLFSFAVGA